MKNYVMVFKEEKSVTLLLQFMITKIMYSKDILGKLEEEPHKDTSLTFHPGSHLANTVAEYIQHGVLT